MPQLVLHTLVGDITFETDGAVVSSDWRRVPRHTPTPILEPIADQLHAYFESELAAVALLLVPSGTTYRRSIWQGPCDIPDEEMRGYLDVARKADSSARSVGRASGCRPTPLIIPCHRVVATAGIGGYSGGDGLPTKRWLLTLENPNRTLLGIVPWRDMT